MNINYHILASWLLSVDQKSVFPIFHFCLAWWFEQAPEWKPKLWPPNHKAEMEKPIRRKARVSASHGGPNRAGLNETLSKNLCSSPLSWTQALVDCLVLVTDVFQYGTFESNQPEVAQWSEPWTYSSEKCIHCSGFPFYGNQCAALFASFFNTLTHDNHKSNSQPDLSDSSVLQ